MRGLIRNATPKAEPSGQLGCRRTDGNGGTSYLRRPRIRPAEFSSAVAVNHSAALVRQESSHWMGRRAWDRGGSAAPRLRRPCCNFFPAEAGPPLGLLLFWSCRHRLTDER